MQGFCIQTFINVAGQVILDRLTVKKEEHLVSFQCTKMPFCNKIIKILTYKEYIPTERNQCSIGR